MKEDEAKKTGCPVGFIGNAISVRNYPDLHERKRGILLTCLASGCMMWRWEPLYDVMQFSGQIVENGRSSTEGYCGLAGKT